MGTRFLVLFVVTLIGCKNKADDTNQGRPPTVVEAPVMPEVKPVTPELKPVMPELNSKEIVWQLGDKISLVALGQYAGADPGAQERVFEEAKILGKALGAEIPPMPAKTSVKSKGLAVSLHYLLKTAGEPLAKQIDTRHGADHTALFELALRSNMLTVIYVPGDSLGTSIAGNFKRNGPKSGLPDRLWRPVVDGIEARATANEVKTAVTKMHSDVAAHLKTQQKGKPAANPN